MFQNGHEKERTQGPLPHSYSNLRCKDIILFLGLQGFSGIFCPPEQEKPTKIFAHANFPRKTTHKARRPGVPSQRLPCAKGAGTRRARRPGEPSLVPPQGVGADTYIGPSLGTTCVAPVGRGDHTPPPGCSARRERHRSAPIPVGSQTPPPPRRGGPMCPPEHAASWDPPTGRHTGRPLQIQLQPSSTPENRAGAEPRPYSRRTPKTASRSTRPPQTSSPTTQNALHDRRHPAPRPNVKKHPRPSPNRGFQRGPQPSLVVSRGSRGENRAPAANQRSVCGGKRRSSGMSEPVPFWRRRGI